MRKLLISFVNGLLIFSMALPGWAAVAHDVTNTYSTTNAALISGSHTPSSTTNGIAMICVTWQRNPIGSLNTVTYGGNAATLVASQSEVSDGTTRAELWRYVGPPAGASTVTATFDGTKNDMRMHVSTYTGVAQGAPTGTAVTSNTFATTASVTVSSNVGELVVDCGLSTPSSLSATVGAGQTERANFGDSGNHFHFGSEEAGASSVAMTWTLGTTGLAVDIGVPLLPASNDQPMFRRGFGVPGMNSNALGGPLP